MVPEYNDLEKPGYDGGIEYERLVNKFLSHASNPWKADEINWTLSGKGKICFSFKLEIPNKLNLHKYKINNFVFKCE